MRNAISVSVIVPVYNERESVALLFKEITSALSEVGRTYEIIFVDDGSTDDTAGIVRALPGAGLISFARNAGKSKALEAGFQEARGEIIMTLDGDLQDDPKEIPRFLAEIEKGSDLVCGWKRTRHDPLEKRLFSKLANGAARLLAGSVVHDMNCGFKAYRAPAARELRFFGDMHRYIPAVVSHMGYHVTEMEVNHRPRQFGRSKYGLSRLLSGFFDLVTLLFLRKFLDRPMHFFGTGGIFLGALGAFILVYMSYLRLALDQTIGNRPLLFFGILLVVVGFQMLSLGLVAELIIRQGTERTLPAIREKKEAEVR